MTMTTTEAIAAVEEILAQLRSVEVNPLAAGDLPPRVAAGELITSAWGNAVYDELLRKRNETLVQWDHAGGAFGASGVYDIGSTSIAALAYPTKMTIWATFHFGNAGMATNWALDLVRFLDNASRATAAPIQAYVPGAWTSASLSWSYAVPAGQLPGFKSRVNVTGLTSGTAGFSSFGIYSLQRTGTP